MMIIRFSKKNEKEKRGRVDKCLWSGSTLLAWDVFLKYHIKHNGYQITWEINNLVFYKDVEMQISTILMNFRIQLINFHDEVNSLQKVMVLFIMSKMMCNPKWGHVVVIEWLLFFYYILIWVVHWIWEVTMSLNVHGKFDLSREHHQ